MTGEIFEECVRNGSHDYKSIVDLIMQLWTIIANDKYSSCMMKMHEFIYV